jgi:hypothetical protein
MWARFQERSGREKLIVLVCIILALLVTLVCMVDVLLLRGRMARKPTAQPQVVQPATAEPKSVPTMAPPEQAIVVVENTATPEPIVIVAPPTTTWRFLRIDADDIATFENVASPGQTLLAKCIDPKRPPPNKGALYTLDSEGILKLQDGGKKYQRFKVTKGQ